MDVNIILENISERIPPCKDTHTHTHMHLKKVLITETSHALWTERIYDYPIPASMQEQLKSDASFEFVKNGYLLTSLPPLQLKQQHVRITH